MRPTWSMVLVAAVLGCAAGVVGTAAVRTRDPADRPDGPAGATPPPHGTTSVRDETQESAPRARVGAQSTPRAESGDPAVRSPSAETPAEPPDGEVRRWIADLARAREAKDLKLFGEALRRLTRSDDATAHAALLALVADPEFDFPESRHAIECGDSQALQRSALPGWPAAVRARYERDGRRAGKTWDAAAWLHLVAAHGDAADLSWIAAQYDAAPERKDQVIAALGLARPDLARAALAVEIRRSPQRDGVWEAIEHLRNRSPADAFALYDEILANDLLRPREDGEFFRAWVRSAPAERLPHVRASVHAYVAGRPPHEAMPAVQALADRGDDVAEFAAVIASCGRELRRLVDEEETADGTGPYYAIEYHKVAQTPENLAALEYAIQQLGEDRTQGCRQILGEIRARTDWK